MPTICKPNGTMETLHERYQREAADSSNHRDEQACRAAYDNRYHKIAAAVGYDEFRAIWFKALESHAVYEAELERLAAIGRQLADRNISLPPLDDVSDYLILAVRKGTMTEQAQQCLGRIVVAISNNEPVTIAAGGQAAVHDVLGERQRQVTVEGWTPERDDAYSDGQLAVAAGYYALACGFPHEQDIGMGHTPEYWPWQEHWWKPRTARENLVRAGALILAEIERLDRASAEVQP